MNDTSTKVFIALGAIAHIVFNTGYNKAKYQQTISVAELNQKKHECDISWDNGCDLLRNSYLCKVIHNHIMGESYETTVVIG